MTLTKDKLKSLYKNKYFIRNSEINMRFSILIELFDEIKKHSITKKKTSTTVR